MLRAIISVLFITMISGCASQQVQDAFHGDQSNTAFVTSSGTVQIKYIDNDEVKAGFVGQEITYRVDAGKRTLLLEYSDLFNVTADDHEKVVSRPAKLTFTAEAGKQYKVANPKHPDLESAKAFAEQPEFMIVDAKTGAVVESAMELSRPRSFVAQLKSAVTPVYEFESDQVAVEPAVDSRSILEQLKLIWTQASETEREEFKAWLSNQP